MSILVSAPLALLHNALSIDARLSCWLNGSRGTGGGKDEIEGGGKGDDSENIDNADEEEEDSDNDDVSCVPTDDDANDNMDGIGDKNGELDDDALLMEA